MTNRKGSLDSSMVTKELEAILYDVRSLRAQLSQAKRDADKGLCEDEAARAEGRTLEFRVSYLFGRLADVMYDLDRRVEEIDTLQENLLDLIDKIEYKSVADAATNKQ